jgi:hypothetical protein
MANHEIGWVGTSRNGLDVEKEMEIRKRALEDLEVVEFLSNNSCCFFNRKEWLHILGEGFKVPVVIYCFEEDGKIRLVLPGMVFNFGIVKMFYSNIPYGGFVGEFELIPQWLTLLEKCLKRDGIGLLRIGRNFNNPFPDLNGFRWQAAYTHLLPLEGMTEEQLWNGYKKRVRRDVRKAEKSGIYIEEVGSSSEIDEMFHLYYQTMRRNIAYTTWTQRSLYSIYEHLVQTGKAKMLLAKKDGKQVAGIILLFSEDTVYYFFSASSEKYFQYCPNDLLVHQAICLAIREGKKYFDFMTSREDDTALMSFKEKWGAQKFPFHFFEKRLSLLRPWIWDQGWKIANSRIGASLIRGIRGRSWG